MGAVPYDPNVHGPIVTESGGAVPYDPAVHGPIETSIGDKIKTAGNWLGTRATNFLTGAAATGRGLADVNKAVVNAVGLPDWAAQPLNALTPGALIGQFGPTGHELAKPVFDNLITKTNTPGPLGPAIDAGSEALLAAPFGPGGVLRNALPSFLGGASQELVGSMPGIKGTPWEPLVRVLTGVGVGGTTAGAQHGVESVYRGLSSSPANVERVSSGLLNRAIEFDKTTLPQMLARQGELGAGAPLVEAGGQNVRGLLQGAIATPGKQRTTAQDFFDARRAELGDTAAATLDRNISPNASVATTVDDLVAQRRAAAGPAYETAGVPSDPRMVKWAIDQPPAPNSPIIKSPVIDSLIEDSKDVQAAIANARRLPEFKDQPATSMAMLDKIYKHIGSLEQDARTPLGAATERSRDIGKIRTQLKDAITEANSDYGRALKAFEDPSKLIAATNKGKEWMRPGVDPAVAIKEFKALPPEAQETARIGIRDWARSQMERTDRNASGLALWSSPANRTKLQGILKPEEFSDLERQMNIVKNAAQTATDIKVGSRTAPMLANQADIAGQVNTSALVDLLKGHPFRAAGKTLGSVLGNVGGARSEAINARLAELLTGTDSTVLPALMEQVRLDQQRRRGALGTGLVVPSVGALGGGTR